MTGQRTSPIPQQLALIDEIVHRNDRRGISAVRPYLPPAPCAGAAQFLLETRGPVLIATGFYVGGAGETDGPLGAVALGQALGRLGYVIHYVTDSYTAPLLAPLAWPEHPIHVWPVEGAEASRQRARALLAQTQAVAVVAVERCGLTRSGRYLNMRGGDISAYTARLDELCLLHPRTVGIGDGGNEIGMGNVYEAVRAAPRLVPDPAATVVSHLVTAAVSNWGAYGIVAALSLLAGRNLLPDPEQERAHLERLCALGATDGFSGQVCARVDGLEWEDYARPLLDLHRLVR
jgi:hypothetical protein